MLCKSIQNSKESGEKCTVNSFANDESFVQKAFQKHIKG